MAKPIKITVKAKDTDGQDAPTVEDLLSQIQDFVDVLHGVENAVTDENGELVWRVTDITRNSPFTFEVTPYSKTFGVNIDSRATKVVETTAKGLSQITESGTRPTYFDDTVMKKAERVNNRLTNGLIETKFDFSQYKDAPLLEITANVAKRTIQHIQEIKDPVLVKHTELGSVEGFIVRVGRDGYKRPLIWIESRLDKQEIKCIPSKGKGFLQVGDHKVSEVLEGMRVRVNGLIHYKNLEQVENIEVENFQIFEPDSELPDSKSIVSPNFTSGVEASEYLEALRKDE
ncbi:MAG: hypothetical protein F4X93_03885 [Proteobacteria bacterium]|nr:hypothetical protein [Pseudomonadota bacterium]